MRLPWDLRWWELLPEAVLGVGLGLFAATERSAAASAFKSSTAIMLMIGVGVAWLVLRLVLLRRPRWRVFRFALFSAGATAVLLVVVFPAYDDKTVVEALPVPATAVVAATPSTASPPTPPTTAFPAAERAAPIHGIDHRASGTAVVYRQADGSRLVGLEDIDIQPGPDYDVYVVPGTDQERTDGGVRLDDLRGNKGTQYYALPGGVDVSSGPWTVLVWCNTFDVPVAGATPT